MIPTAFLALAGLAVLAALAFALLPLLIESPERRGIKRRLHALDDLEGDLPEDELDRRRTRLREELSSGSDREGSVAMMIGLLILIPAATVGLYRVVGQPDGLSESNHQVYAIRDTLTQLAGQVERHPEQVEAWVRLGLSYKELGEFSSAEHALRRALYIDNDNPFIQVELAETLLFGSGGSQLPDEATALLSRAAELDPGNQKALWLLGIDAFQNQRFEEALVHWEALDTLLPDGSVRQSVREQIARARQAASGSAIPPALPADHPPIADEGPAASGPVFPVEVAIDPALAEGLDGSETVFLIARASQGPPAPLAVRRFSVSDLPLQVELSDTDAMVEGLSLSAFPEIRLTARVSRSGRAEPAPGDLEGETGPLSILDTPRASVLIDRVR